MEDRLDVPVVFLGHDAALARRLGDTLSEISWDPDYRINGKKVDPEFGWVMTHQFNMLHNCPVLAVPSGHAASGVPTFRGPEGLWRSFRPEALAQTVRQLLGLDGAT